TQSLAQKGELPDAWSVLTHGVGSGAAAGLGYIAGKLVGSTWFNAMDEANPGSTKALSDASQAYAEKTKTEMTAAAQSMDNSGVVIDGNSVSKLGDRIENAINQDNLMRQDYRRAPAARDAINRLRE